MALKTNKNITLTGQSMINNSQVVYMSANISTDGNSNGSITTTITDQTTYAANKTECRQDISDFETAVYAAQDEITSSTTTTSTTA